MKVKQKKMKGKMQRESWTK